MGSDQHSHDLAEESRATAERHRMFPPAAPVLAMVSGGGDSVALLRLLAAGELGAGGPLRVLHVNHLLRGDESDADERFVRGLCDELGVECRVVRHDVAAYAQEAGLNLEDAGRRVRYRFADDELDALCDETGTPRSGGRIATAHTRDDRVETFLMRLASGSGAGGLSAIPYVRGRIVRPLLDVGRAELRGWLEREGVSWREDATNDDLERTRARVRATLVPGFEALNPRFAEGLARTLDILAEEDALLEAMAEQFGRDFARIEAGVEIRFDRALMSTLSRAMLRRAVRSALVTAFPDASRIEAEHVDAIVAGMGDEQFARDLPYGLRAYSEYGTLVVIRGEDRTQVVPVALLEIPGSVDLGRSGSITAEIVPTDDVSGTPDSVAIDATSIRSPLVVDSVRPGDRMRPLGMTGTKKLSDLLVDEKVPQRTRVAVPVVRDGERIVWLAGVRMSEEYKVGSGSDKVARLTWRRES